MTSLDRAKSFLRGNGKKLALAVVPLAAIAVAAVPANAGTTGLFPTFAPGNVSVVGNTTGVTATMTGSAALPVGPNGVQGVSDSGHFVQNAGVSGGTTQLIIDFSGTGSGFFAGTTMPIGWSFTAVTSQPILFSPSLNAPNLLTSAINWLLTVQLTTTGGTATTYFPGPLMTPQGIVPPNGSVSGTGLAAINPGTITGYDMKLEIDWVSNLILLNPTRTNAPTGAATLTLDIPAHTSIDINPASAVPEPASLLLFAPGLGLLLLRRSRKKSSV